MRRAGRNALALLIVFCMMVSLLPITASAGGNDHPMTVGETYTFGLRPILEAMGNNCCSNDACPKKGMPLIDLVANDYRNYSCSTTDPSVLGNFKIEKVKGTDAYGGYALECTFEALKPGMADITLKTEYSYQYPGGTETCPTCGTVTTLDPNTNWIAEDSQGVITLHVTVYETHHTVIYTDGVDGEEIFPDEEYTVAHGGTRPGFSGEEPSRAGYEFTGWEPALFDTVYKDQTYTATWKANAVTLWDQLTLSTEIVNGSSVKPGETLTYKTTVSNNTGKALTGLIVDEALDSRLTYVGATGDGSYDAGICTWTIPSLAAGASAVLTIEIKVQEGLADGTVITNRAAITGADAGDGDTLPASVGSSASATVYADQASAPEKPGDATLTALLKDAVTITCTDTAAGHTDGTWSALTGAYSVGLVTKNTAEDGSEYYTCEVTVPAEQYIAEYNKTQPGHSLKEGESAEKTVKLKHDGSSWAVMSGVPVSFQVTCAQTPTPPTEVDWTKLTITSACEGKAAPGESVTFTTTVTNNTGKDLDNVEVAVKLDSNLTYLGLRAADYNAETGIWRIGALANGEQAVLNVTANVKEGTPDGTQLTSAATIEKASAEGEELPEKKGASSKAETIVNEKPEAPDEATVTELLKEAVLIKCAKTGAGHKETKINVLAGTYTLGEVKKDGDVYICDVKIQASKFVAAYGSLVGKTHSLVSGEAKEKTIRLKYDADRWTVQSGVPVTFYVTCTQTPRPEPVSWEGLSISIDENKVIASPGESVTYTVTVKNNTGRTLENVTVSEVLDQNLTFDSSTWTKNSTYDKKTGLWTISDLADGGSAVLKVKGIVALDTEDDTQILNVANITYAAADTGETMPDQKLSNMVKVTVRSNAATRPLTLSYDANGGTNAPARQEVDVYLDTAEVQLRVSESKPSRLGYYFQGWSTTRNGRVQYRGGDWITISGNTTLYAVWVKPTASPRTGDASNLTLWSTLAGASMIALGAATVPVKKKSEKTKA